MAAASAVTRHPLSVEDILCLSGYAFHARWCLSDGRPTGCPGSVSLEQGYLPAALMKHSGWQLRILIAQGWDRPDMQGAAPAIRAAIDAGMAVVIEDEYIDASVLYGYVSQGETYLLNTYMKGQIEAELAGLSQDPAYAFIIEEHVEPAPFREVFSSILSNAITWWHQEHEPNTCGGPNMRIGRTALEHWARFYDSIDELASSYHRGKGALFYNSLMNYQHLYENRKAATSFLRGHAAQFQRAEGAIRAAAAAYEEEAQILESALGVEDTAWSDLNRIRASLVGRRPEAAAWAAARSVDQTDVWPPELQRRERQIMEEALRLEASAMEHLREAYAQINH